MMVNAIKQIIDIPTEIITFSDDMDGLRKIPDNVPNQELLNQNLHKPLTSVPDPFKKYNSFGQHNNEMLKNFLNEFKFNYIFKSSTDTYKKGFFNDALLLVLEKYEMSQIQEIFSNINDDIEEIIKETAKLLSVICDNLTIITFPKSEITKLRHIELVFIDEYSIFFVIIDSNLMVKKELIKSETVVTKEELIKISNKLNELFKGKTKDSINIVDLNGLEKELGAKIIDVLTILDSEQTEYEINGLVRLIAQPEFSEIEKNNVITDMIEGDRDLLSQIFSDNIDNNTFDVTIGSENKESKLHDLSLIKMSYGLDNAFLGSLAIVGPTRMTYIKIIGVLRVVSELMRNRIGFLLRV